MICYYAWNTDEGALLQSASGGIFALLGKKTIERGGAVFGARFKGEGFRVIHGCARSMEALKEMQGSKYAQSMMDGAYRQAEELLKADVPVLFSGTPCQIAALRACLAVRHVDTSELVTAEVLCHGVTNAGVVRRYAASIEWKKGKRVAALRFRTKEKPWYSKGSSMELHYEDGTREIVDHLLDPFYATYVNNVVLRPSCYHCPFARLENRPADFTLGDFWGAEDYLRDRKPLKQGIGLVLVNSPKAARIWGKLIEEGAVAAEALDVNLAIPRNNALVEPAVPHPMREAFFSRLYSEDFSELVDDCFGVMLRKNRIKNWIGYDNMRRLERLKRKLRGGAT